MHTFGTEHELTSGNRNKDARMGSDEAGGESRVSELEGKMLDQSSAALQKRQDKPYVDLQTLHSPYRAGSPGIPTQ